MAAMRKHEPLGEAAIFATLEAQYAETRLRLADDPEHQRWLAAAAMEEIQTPNRFVARNMVALREEIAMPSILATVERARAERDAMRRAQAPWGRLVRALTRNPTKSETGADHG